MIKAQPSEIIIFNFFQPNCFRKSVLLIFTAFNFFLHYQALPSEWSGLNINEFERPNQIVLNLNRTT